MSPFPPAYSAPPTPAESSSAAAAIAAHFLAPPTGKQRLLARLFEGPDNRFQAVCQHLTLDDCAADAAALGHPRQACDMIHFEPLVMPHTDLSYGHCSYLNTCHRMTTCKYMHFRPTRRPGCSPFRWSSSLGEPSPPLTSEPTTADQLEALKLFDSVPLRHPLRALASAGLVNFWAGGGTSTNGHREVQQMPPQWIDADVQSFDFGIIGKFDVVVADPPWDIHMSLPYGTMSDDALRAMPFPELQDEGYIFLWVTGRAMELGRELLAVWGYTRVDELIWVKIGQTQRLIRTGRTGHWLNHTKEHCLVGAKVRNPSDLPLCVPLPSLSTTYPSSHASGVPPPLPSWSHPGLSSDVIVSEVRHTSRKPDELYSIIERLCPGGRKLELFGRRHNARNGWLTIGNQLKGDNIVDPQLKARVDAWRQSRGG